MHHRKPLDPKVHFIAGALIAGFSAYTLIFVDVVDKAVMQLFLYIGLGFIALAFIKLGIRYVKSGGLEKDEQAVVAKITKVPVSPQEQAEQEYQAQMKRQAQLQQQQQQQSAPKVIQCRLCSTRNYDTSNYCHMCGYKLR